MDLHFRLRFQSIIGVGRQYSWPAKDGSVKLTAMEHLNLVFVSTQTRGLRKIIQCLQISVFLSIK